MNSEIVLRALQTRCYRCSRPKVDMVCHHCGRAICDSDGPTEIPSGKYFENPEFSNLDLGQSHVGEEGIHCSDCVHYVKTYKLIFQLAFWLTIIGLILAAVVFWTQQILAITIGVLTITASIGLFYQGFSLQRHKYRQEIMNCRPPFPVIGKIRAIAVSEFFNGSIYLDSHGQYTGSVDPPSGKIALTLQFTPRDRERLKVYRDKYERYFSEDLEFNAGFAVLQGVSNLTFDNPKACMPKRVNTLALTGKISEQPFLSGTGGGKDTYWRIRENYSFTLDDNKTLFLPIQIVPSLVQEGAQKSIELVLQLPPETYQLPIKAATTRIEELSLHAPIELGKVEVADPSPIIGMATADEISFTQMITWKGVGLSSGGRYSQSKRFYIRFENTVEPSTILKGRLRIRFDGAFSGIDGVRTFYPLGNKREDLNSNRYTYLDVDFHLDLGGLRFQEAISVEERITREGIVPDYRVITAITNAISSAEFYIKRVIENPPRTSKVGAHITYRYWDIVGRFYDGVYPIDFHLVLTGEGVHVDRRLNIGKMQVDISVQGTVANEDMRSRVVALRDRLVEVINSTLDELPTDILPTSDDSFSSNNKISILNGKMEELDDALLKGKISESRYEEMRTRFEKELEMFN